MEEFLRNVKDGEAVNDLPASTNNSSTQLPEWCNVYEDLSDSEIADVEKSILRTIGARAESDAL